MSSIPRIKPKCIIFDLDNTLYDWVSFFVPSFYAMVEEVINITGWEREELLDGFKYVHQRHNNVEHPFSLLEVDLVQQQYGNLSKQELSKIFDSAFLAFNRMRKKTLEAYPDVKEVLNSVNEAGIDIIAHTDSSLYAVVDRMERIGLTKFFNRIYCRGRSASEHPDGHPFANWAQDFPFDKVVELPPNEKKPDPSVLLDICSTQGHLPTETAYVGDSLARDILMAHKTGVISIWAKYGTHHPSKMYEMLVRVTHWTHDDVIRERSLSKEVRSVTPDFVLEKGIKELTTVINI
jgi:FMN phosphatase YigB (HAD superfamily)